MRRVSVFFLLVSLAVDVACSPGRSAEMKMGNMEDVAPPRVTAPGSPPVTDVHSISLPHDEAFAPPGPGRDAFVTACIVCHSPRYITSQPPFSRTVWKGIVQKMIDTYGAHITTTQAAEIVGYLAYTNGAHLIGGEGE